MNYSSMAFIADETVIAVKCVFEDLARKEYTFKYKLKEGEKLEEGDLVLVESGGASSTYGMAIVKVVKVDVEVDLDAVHGHKWIAHKLDLKEFAALKKAEAKLISTIQSQRLQAKRARYKEALGVTNLPSLEDLTEKDI